MKHPSKIFMKYFLRQLLISSIPILILGTLGFFLTCHDIRQTAAHSAYHTLDQSGHLWNEILSDINAIETTFNPDSFSGFSLKHIVRKKGLNYSDAVKYPIFSSILNTFVNTSPSIRSAYLYWPNDYGNLLVSNKGLTTLKYMEDTDWLKTCESFSDNHSNTRLIQLRTLSGSKEASSAIITLYQKIITLDYPTAKGTVIINLDPSILEAQLSQLCTFSGQQLCLFADENTLLASSPCRQPSVPAASLTSKEELLLAALEKMSAEERQICIKKKGCTIFFQKDETAPFFYMSVIPNNQLYAMPARLLCITGILVAFSCIVSLFLAAAYSRRLSRNVQSIMDIFHAAQNGDPLPHLPASSGDEQSYIITSLISTFIRQDYLSIQLSEKNYRAKTLELIALQSQINPHFLFNTLETIRLKSFQMTDGPNQISPLIENLCDILRYTLSDPHEQVSLESEIAYSKSYLYIQKLRYNNQFHVIWEYDPDILPLSTVKLLIQPLLENSIHHGIAPSDRECLIKVKIYQKQEHLYLHIIDTGVGMTSEQKDSLLSRIADNQTPYQHIGLANTWKRLVLVYGEQARIRIWSREQRGTAITLILPLLKNTSPQPFEPYETPEMSF